MPFFPLREGWVLARSQETPTPTLPLEGEGATEDGPVHGASSRWEAGSSFGEKVDLDEPGAGDWVGWGRIGGMRLSSP
ncbi:hypothetical protein SAMN02745223_02561 [Devosia limi DSM 17137]|uniref:Uncharacterized protein n=1 Tax=Devosia limi DSM 17137 TaxID=1121477 RepID=A0A1M5BEG2_9HYPH|nr:hypothetical protein SAMN02745223_02561 [Devosia limi DSM 17137]